MISASRCDFKVSFYFHHLGPLGPVGLVVAKSVCVLLVCVFVPFPCFFFGWSDWSGACLVHGLLRIVPRPCNLNLNLDLDLDLDLE